MVMTDGGVQPPTVQTLSSSLLSVLTIRQMARLTRQTLTVLTLMRCYTVAWLANIKVKLTAG